MDRHYYFLRSFQSNADVIKRFVPGNWLVWCGHCGVSMAGFVSGEGPITEVEWKQEGAFFGTFYFPERGGFLVRKLYSVNGDG